MSSLESHTMVPTLTMFGRVSEWIRLLSMAEAAVTGSLLPRDQSNVPRGVESVSSRSPGERRAKGYAQPRGLQLAEMPPLAHAEADTGLPAFTPAAVFTPFHLAGPLSLFLLVAAVLYGDGVIRLRRRGDHSPIGRTVAFVVGGPGSTAFMTMSRLEAYDPRSTLVSTGCTS
jgi:hypothetical protein